MGLRNGARTRTANGDKGVGSASFMPLREAGQDAPRPYGCATNARACPNLVGRIDAALPLLTKWANPTQAKEDKPGRGARTLGGCSGGQPRALEEYVLALRDAIKITAL
jgi:hypothetical protein